MSYDTCFTLLATCWNMPATLSYTIFDSFLYSLTFFCKSVATLSMSGFELSSAISNDSQDESFFPDDSRMAMNCFSASFSGVTRVSFYSAVIFFGNLDFMICRQASRAGTTMLPKYRASSALCLAKGAEKTSIKFLI